MAFPTGTYTEADVDVDIPKIWGQQINDYFRYGLQLASFFTDRSDELADGGMTVYTPNLSALTTNAKSNGAAVTLSSPTYTSQTLVVSTWQEASFTIEDRELAQVKKSYYLQSQIAKGGAWEVAQDLDNAISALFDGFSNSIGATGTNLVDSNLLAALALAETLMPNIYSGDVAWILHPNTFYRQIGNIDKLTLWQNTGTEKLRNSQPTRMLYGVPVIVTAAVPYKGGTSGRVNCLAHKDAIHWARLSLPVKAEKGYIGDMGVRVQQSYQHPYLADLVTIDLCYGVIENRDTYGIELLSHATVA